MFPAGSLILTLAAHRACFRNPALVHVCSGPSTVQGSLLCFFSQRNVACWEELVQRGAGVSRDFHCRDEDLAAKSTAVVPSSHPVDETPRELRQLAKSQTARSSRTGVRSRSQRRWGLQLAGLGDAWIGQGVQPISLTGRTQSPERLRGLWVSRCRAAVPRGCMEPSAPGPPPEPRSGAQVPATACAVQLPGLPAAAPPLSKPLAPCPTVPSMWLLQGKVWL